MKKHVFLTSLFAIGLSCGAHAATDVTFAGDYTTADGKTANVSDTLKDTTYEYTKSDGTTATAKSSEDPNLSDFTYTGTDGSEKSLNDGDVPAQADYTADSTADGTNVKTTQEIVAGATASRDNYTYTNGAGEEVTLGEAAQDMVETYTLGNGKEITVKNGEAPTFDGTQYEVSVEGGDLFTLTKDGSMLVDKNGNKQTPDAGTPLEAAFLAAQEAFNTDKTTVDGFKATTADAWETEQTNFAAANTVFEDDSAKIEELDNNFATVGKATEALDAAKAAQQTAKEAYAANDEILQAAKELFDAPIADTIANGANSAIDASLEEGGTLNAALAEKASVEDVEANTANIATNTQAIADNKTAIESEASRAEAAESELSTKIDTNTTAIAANKTAIESEVARATAAEEALGGRIDTNVKAIAENKTAIETNATNIAANKQAIADEASERKAADAQLAKDIKAGDEMTLAAAKAYADTKNEAALKSANSYTDKKVNALEKELSAGIASASAMSAIEVSNVGKGEVSVGGGYGYYNSQSAVAFGAAMGLTDNWSINAAAGLADSNVSFRAGTNYKFKLFK